jgi:predicted enzyme related to lactoylglutathione lyase
MADATQRGEFVWHDLITPNAAGAHEFYGKVVGWKTQPWESDPGYVMFAARSGPIGGVSEARAATPHWLPYIGTADVHATVEAATRLGARLETAPTALPNGGRYAVLVDPQGAVFGIHASAGGGSAPRDTPPQAGEFSWHELATSVAPNIAFGFYAALFDWDEMAQHDMGPMGMYLIFGRKGRQIGGMFTKAAEGSPGAGYWLGYVSVTDLEGTVERAKAARGSLLAGPMDVPGGDRIAQLMDPYGAFFALHKAAAQAGAAVSGGSTARKPPKMAVAKPAQPKTAKKRAAAKAPAKRTKPAAAAKPARKPAKKAAATKKAATRKPAKARPKATAKAKAKTKTKTKTKTKAKKTAKKRNR